MNILAIETTGAMAGVAVLNETRPLGQIQMAGAKPHAETLLPMAENLLAGLGLTMADMAYIACSAGPGSFTGVRIGAATAKGLAMGANIQIVPVPTLAALAYNNLEAGRLEAGSWTKAARGAIVPVLDARRGQVYAGGWKLEAGSWKGREILPADCRMMADVLDWARGLGEPVTFTGDGVFVHEAAILAAGFAVAPSHLRLQSPLAVGALALRIIKEGGALDAADFAPFYARKHEAELKRERAQCQI